MAPAFTHVQQPHLTRTPGITVEATGPGAETVLLEGDIDVAFAGRLTDELSAEYARGYRHLTVDLADVTFLDATALEVLVHAHFWLRGVDGSMRLAGVGRTARRLMKVTGLDGVLTVAEF